MNDTTNEVLIGNEDPATSKEYKAALDHAKEVYKHIKKKLKAQSKSDLINLIVKYSSDLQELQNVSQQLFEENKTLKEQLNEANK